MTSRRHPHDCLLRGIAGVTLLELLIALTLLVIVLGGIYGYVTTSGRSARQTNSFLQIQAQARAALDNIVDEIRWAQQVTAADAAQVTVLVPQATPFSAASPYLVTFAYDPALDVLTRQEDPDATGPQPPGAAEAVAHFLVRKDGGAGVVFEYFDTAGASLGGTPPDLTEVARVRVTLVATLENTSRTLVGDTALRGR